MEAIVRELAADSRQGLAQDPWIDHLMRDLEQHRGGGIVIAGDGQEPLIHALAHSLNNRVGMSERLCSTRIHWKSIQSISGSRLRIW